MILFWQLICQSPFYSLIRIKFYLYHKFWYLLFINWVLALIKSVFLLDQVVICWNCKLNCRFWHFSPIWDLEVINILRLRAFNVIVFRHKPSAILYSMRKGNIGENVAYLTYILQIFEVLSRFLFLFAKWKTVFVLFSRQTSLTQSCIFYGHLSLKSRLLLKLFHFDPKIASDSINNFVSSELMHRNKFVQIDLVV